MLNREQLLFEYLMMNHQGRDAAIHSKELEMLFGICTRTLRYYVSNLRKCGVPICSDERGYWIGTNSQEISGTIKRFGGYISELGNVRAGLAYANIQMKSRPQIHKESIEITVRVN